MYQTTFSFLLPRQSLQPLFRQCLATTKGASQLKGLWWNETFYINTEEYGIQLSKQEVCNGIQLFTVTYGVSKQYKVMKLIESLPSSKLDTIAIKEVAQRPVLDENELAEEKKESNKHE